MLHRLFPDRFDNDYRGARAALVILGLIAFIKAGQGVGAYVNPQFVAETADSLPLARYGAAGSLILQLFQVWGLGQFLLALLSLLALIRYRSMTPLMLLVLLVEQVARKAIFLRQAPERKADTFLLLGHFPVAEVINYGFIAVLFLGLALSLTRPR